MTNIIENFFGSPEPDQVREPWRCDSCKRLIYNYTMVDGEPKFNKGAPLPHYLTDTYKQVCTLCFDMDKSLDESKYFKSMTPAVANSLCPDPVGLLLP